MTPAAYAAYNHVATSTVNSKERILCMLYERALKFLHFARVGIAEHDIPAKGEAISKVIAILAELDCALDHEVGGELAENLSSLYQYMMSRLTHANIKNDSCPLDEVEKLLGELQEAFEQAAQQNELTASAPVEAMSPMSNAKGISLAV
jgi:flagellar protein FliS